MSRVTCRACIHGYRWFHVCGLAFYPPKSDAGQSRDAADRSAPPGGAGLLAAASRASSSAAHRRMGAG